MTIEKIDALGRLEEMREEWNSLVNSSWKPSVFLTNEWFCVWYESFGISSQLSVLLFRDPNGHLYGAVPLMETAGELRFLASREVTDYCDFIVESGREDQFYEECIEYFRFFLDKSKPLRLINIPGESPTLSMVPLLANRNDFKHRMAESEFVLRLDLPHSYEDYLSSLPRKNRHELQRKIRRIESQNAVLYKLSDDSESVQTTLDTFMELHKRSSSLKNEFWEEKGMDSFFASIVRLFAQKRWIELSLLSLSSVPAAALLSFVFHNEIHFYNIAFNKDYSIFSPGIYLFDRAIRSAIDSGKIRADFLRGREKYKYYFGAKEYKIFDLVLSKTELVS